ncbi:hypothetical protein TeGR_g11986 [Tetraparma gracilis]|uniref:Tyrosine-protein kinase ephrin type A/B receptor-like domain-containing protein n=1 Tax=Tetraparma gracilis TaxID=2962635 RepID=A0ABQ6NC66_9STRA|nr:hypothetical protein TeGR_g11986 [Tetraparma gracilis]
MNGIWTPAGNTASNHPYYTHSSFYLFYDPDCKSQGFFPRWIFSETAPSLTALSDLDEDGTCRYMGRWVDDLPEGVSDPAPPLGTESWRISCGIEWEDIEWEEHLLSISFTSPPPSCPPGSSPSASNDECEACWPGLTSGSTDSDRCTPCAASFYPSSTSSACTECPPSSPYSPFGSKSASDCVLDPTKCEQIEFDGCVGSAANGWLQGPYTEYAGACPGALEGIQVYKNGGSPDMYVFPLDRGSGDSIP